jgi:hypothetical protein
MRRRRMVSRNAERRGFVLLMVLMLIVLGALLLTQYSMQGLRLATQAEREERELQARWGRWSAAQAVMMRADRFLQGAGKLKQPNAEFPKAATDIDLLFRFGEAEFQVRVFDLDSVVNINTAIRHSGASGLQRLLETTLSPELRTAIRQPRKTAEAAGNRGSHESIDSWGELLDLKGLLGEPTGMRRFADLQRRLTCWGSGQLNIGRCSDQSLSTLGHALGRSGLFDRIIRKRNKGTSETLSELISTESRSVEDSELLQNVLRENSTAWCVSVSSGQETPGLLLIRESGSGVYADRISVFSLE